MLGSSLCRLFIKTDEVYALHRDVKCYVNCSSDFSFDLSNQKKLQSVFDEVKPDLVIHCAGMINIDQCEKYPELSYQTNVNVTENIALLCDQETKLVYISTDQVYGESKDHSEVNNQLRPLNQYGKTKIIGERRVVENAPNSIIIRTNIFGWNVKPGEISSAEWIYHNLKNKEKLFLFNDYIFSPIYTEYLGAIIIQLMEMDFIGVVNVGSPKPCSKYDFGIQLAKEFGFDNSLIKMSSIIDHFFEARRENNIALNINKITNLGIKIPDYKASIKRFNEN